MIYKHGQYIKLKSKTPLENLWSETLAEAIKNDVTFMVVEQKNVWGLKIAILLESWTIMPDNYEITTVCDEWDLPEELFKI